MSAIPKAAAHRDDLPYPIHVSLVACNYPSARSQDQGSAGLSPGRNEFELTRIRQSDVLRPEDALLAIRSQPQACKDIAHAVPPRGW